MERGIAGRLQMGSGLVAGVIHLALGATLAAQETGTIAFVSDRDGNREIYSIQPDGTGLARLTEHPARDQAPAISHDGTRIAFTSDRSGIVGLWIMGVGGERPTLVAELPNADFGWAWSPDGKTIAWSYQRPDDGTHDLASIDVETGIWELLTDTPGVEEITPDWGSDGESLLFFRDDGAGTTLNRLDLTERTVTRVSAGQLPAAAFPNTSPDGTRVVARVRADNGFDIVQIAVLSGAVTGLITGPTNDWGASWSPSGSHLVFGSDRAGGSDIFTLDVTSGVVRQLTRDPGRDWLPTWR